MKARIWNTGVALFLLLWVGVALLILTHARAEDARVLPQGRSRLSFTYAQTEEISQSYNAQGKPTSLTDSYNVDLSSSNLKKFDGGIGRLVDGLNALGLHYNSKTGEVTTNKDQPALGDALSRGQLQVDAQAMRTQWNFAFQHGLTDRLSVGLMLPMIRTRVTVSNSLSGRNTAEDIYQYFNGAQKPAPASGMSPSSSALTTGLSTAPGHTGAYGEITDGLNQLRSANTETLQSLLTSKGYSRFEDHDESGVGDLVFGGRYKYLHEAPRSGEWIASAQLGATAPTGKLKDPSQITAVDFGQGAWDIGAAHILNYSPRRWVTLSQGIHHTYRLPSSRKLRVRRSASDVIPDASTEEEVGMKLGDKTWATAGTKFNVTHAFSIEGSYEWLWKGQDRYSGSTPGRDYSYLSDDTASSLETWQIGASLSSIPSFLGKSFPLPGEFSINYFHPVRGTNSVIAPYLTAELALFF